MERFSTSDLSPDRPRLASNAKEVNVHVLSESVFCPRAAILALESGEDTGDEEPSLGPRLDEFADYDEHRFVEELHAAWGKVRLWLTLAAPAALLVFLVWRFVSPLAAAVASLPLFYVAAQLWDAFMRIFDLVRERADFKKAVPVTIDMRHSKSGKSTGGRCARPGLTAASRSIRTVTRVSGWWVSRGVCSQRIPRCGFR